MIQKELEEILEKHKKWLLNEDGGELANLANADLRNANLANTDLRNANLQGADLQDANLANTDLRYANLQGANLIDANLANTDLRYANLQGANLIDADLRGAFLSNTDLQGAFLKNADLAGADIDYSCLPLWCGSLRTHFDDLQLRQIAYHLVKAGLHSMNASPGTKHELAKLIDFANEFHHADECGIITLEESKS